MELPFVLIGRAHTDDAYSFCAQGEKHYGDYRLTALADGAPALRVRRLDRCVIKKVLVKVGEVQMVLGQVGLAFRFIPYDPHGIIM
jgi:hypothetical protein